MGSDGVIDPAAALCEPTGDDEIVLILDTFSDELNTWPNDGVCDGGVWEIVEDKRGT